MATDWSEEAKARRSAAARKAAETRKANRAKSSLTPEARKAGVMAIKAFRRYNPPISRVARWALSGVSHFTLRG